MVVYPHRGIPLSRKKKKKEQAADTHSDVDGARKHYAKEKNPDTKTTYCMIPLHEILGKVK